MQDLGYVLPGVGRVPLWGKGGALVGWATVELADLSLVTRSRWRRYGDGYAYRIIRVPGVGRRNQYMHHVVLGVPYGTSMQDGVRTEVDHINRNRLDNRRSNLRIVTRAQNMQNRSKGTGTTSRFRGVSRHSQNGKWWVARGKKDGRTIYLGIYEDEEEAGRVAAEFRKQHHPFSFD